MKTFLYYVSHQFFYDIIFTNNENDPFNFLDAVLQDREQFLIRTKKILLELLNEPNEQMAKMIDSLSFSYMYLENLIFVIINLPEPQFSTEAFKIAVVFQFDPINNRYTSIRYFTAELGYKVDEINGELIKTSDPALYICEWHGKGEKKVHCNYGSFKYFNLATLIDRILQLYHMPRMFFPMNDARYGEDSGNHSEVNFLKNTYEVFPD